MSLFKTLDEVVRINGVQVDVVVEIHVEEDDLSPEDDFDFGNEAENAAYLERFKSGELFVGVISVKARAVGEVGIDSLGACHLQGHRGLFTASVDDTVGEHGMIRNALDDLVVSILSRAAELAPFVLKRA